MRRLIIALVFIFTALLGACNANTVRDAEVSKVYFELSEVCLPLVTKGLLSGSYDEHKLKAFIGERAFYIDDFNKQSGLISFPLKYGKGFYGLFTRHTNELSYLYISAGAVDYYDNPEKSASELETTKGQYCSLTGEFSDIETLKAFQRQLIDLNLDLKLQKRRIWNLSYNNTRVKVKETRLCGKGDKGSEFLIRFAYFPMPRERLKQKFSVGIIEQTCDASAV